MSEEKGRSSHTDEPASQENAKTDKYPGGTSRTIPELVSRRAKWFESIALDVEVGGQEFRLAFILAYKFWSKRTGLCNPSLETLAKLLGADNEKTPRRYLQTLGRAGYLSWRRGGKGNSNRYILAFDDRTFVSDQNEQSRRDDRTKKSGHEDRNEAPAGNDDRTFHDPRMSDQGDAEGDRMTGHSESYDRTFSRTEMSDKPSEVELQWNHPSSEGAPTAPRSSSGRETPVSTSRDISSKAREAAGSRSRLKKGDRVTLGQYTNCLVMADEPDNGPVVLKPWQDTDHTMIAERALDGTLVMVRDVQ